MKKTLGFLGLFAIAAVTTQAQVTLSSGLTYSQNFDSLASTSTGTTVPWTDNSTLAGWYASRAYNGGVYAPSPYTSYRVAGGENTSGWIYSFGTNGVGSINDRAFGSISSGTPQTNAFGLRFQNNTADILGNIKVTYTGEQWRNGGNANAQRMYFTFRVSSSAITDPTPGDESLWTAFSGLTFLTPTVGATAIPLDGNDPANRTLFSNILLPGITLNPGDEIFLRWYDINDSGNDHGFGVDDMTVNFEVVPEPSVLALGALGCAALGLLRRRSVRS